LPPTETKDGVQYSVVRVFYGIYSMKQQQNRNSVDKKFPSFMRLRVLNKILRTILPNIVIVAKKNSGP